MIQQHQASETFTDQNEVPDSELQARDAPCNPDADTARISTTWYQMLHGGSGHRPGYLFLKEAVLDFLDEQWARCSFTGDGGKGEDDGSCLWLEIEEKQLNGFLNRLFSESSD